MKIRKGRKTLFFGVCAAAIFFLGMKFLGFFGADERLLAADRGPIAKHVLFQEDGLSFDMETEAETVGEFLNSEDIKLNENDRVLPNMDEEVLPGMRMVVERMKKISLKDGNEKREVSSSADTVERALADSNIRLNEYDIVFPGRNYSVKNGMKVEITRVTIEKKIIDEDILFEKFSKEDDDLPWRERRITQKGELGIREVTWEIISHNGKEITRKAVEKKVTKDPVKETAIQGTYMKLGKTNNGWGTWYTQPKNMVYSFPKENGMTAASPWIAIGQYVKVTNKANGKFVVVRINDRGPFGKNRIIDINTPAFAKIASLGAGVIDVKVEEILN